MKQRTRTRSFHLFALSAATLSVLAWAPVALRSAAAQPVPAPVKASSPVIFLDQGWSAADRAWYYQASQGSAVLSYDIFLNLEVAKGQDLFRADANSDRFGLIPQPPDAQTNPDALPIGLSKTVVKRGDGVNDIQVGVTCAACHNGQLNYQGKRVRIDGGVGNTFDYMSYVKALDDSMQATLADKEKFERLAVRLGAMGTDAKADLAKRFAHDAEPIRAYRTRTIASPIPWGPARIDALGLIVDRVTATATGIGENWSTPLAPTKPPFLWNAPHASWTQWQGSQQDPIRRNFIETMGVFMPMNLHSKTPEEGLFDSNAVLPNLQKIENQLARLAPPKWPEEVFGTIDRQKAAAGKALFANNCAGCHNAYPYTWTDANKYGKRFLEVGLVPYKYVGTDPGQFIDLRPYAIPGNIAPYLPAPFTNEEAVPTFELYVTSVNRMVERALSKLTLTPEEEINLHGYRELPVAQGPRGVYKAAPREGVWATPPFLHNGSVPNLYEMLVPAKERSKTFYVGREFDPVKVGLDTGAQPGAFLFDTSLRGNSNAGHSFENGPRGAGVVGRLLTEKERWQLVEYLKSIPEEAGRITPFGGPADAVKGTSKWSRF